MITEIKPQFSERQMWEQQAQPIIASSGLQSRNEHIMQSIRWFKLAMFPKNPTDDDFKYIINKLKYGY